MVKITQSLLLQVLQINFFLRASGEMGAVPPLLTYEVLILYYTTRNPYVHHISELQVYSHEISIVDHICDVQNYDLISKTIFPPEEAICVPTQKCRAYPTTLADSSSRDGFLFHGVASAQYGEVPLWVPLEEVPAQLWVLSEEDLTQLLVPSEEDDHFDALLSF